MVKKVRKDIFITALIIVVGLLLFGFYVGKIWDDLRTDNVAGDLNENSLDILSILINEEFFESFNTYDCDLIDKRLSSMSLDLYKVGQRLSEYDRKKLFEKDEYMFLKTKYFLLELRTYFNFLDFKKECDSNQTIILFFYDIGDLDSERQGYVLDNFVKREDINIRVFSIDREHNETTIDLIKNYYEVSKSPTIIINNEIKKEGFVDVAELIEILENGNM